MFSNLLSAIMDLMLHMEILMHNANYPTIHNVTASYLDHIVELHSRNIYSFSAFMNYGGGGHQARTQALLKGLHQSIEILIEEFESTQERYSNSGSRRVAHL